MTSAIDGYVLAAWLDIEPVTIRSWATRGLISRRGRDQRGRTLYDPAEVARCAARHASAESPRMSDGSATVTPGTAVPSSAVHSVDSLDG